MVKSVFSTKDYETPQFVWLISFCFCASQIFHQAGNYSSSRLFIVNKYMFMYILHEWTIQL